MTSLLNTSDDDMDDELAEIRRMRAKLKDDRQAKLDSMDPIPSFADFCFSTPIFRAFEYLSPEHDSAIDDIMEGSFAMDYYCTECKRSSHFKTSSTARLAWSDQGNGASYLPRKVRCSRDESHIYWFIFRLTENHVEKVGQFPSSATISLAEITHYKRILGAKLHKELSRGIGLAAHGVGIGSFVYLRRVFESLVERAHQSALIAVEGWDESQYRESRMSEKIGLLSGHLPQFMVENRSLYSLLSEGVHSLDEDECLDMFPVLKTGIEAILNEEINRAEQARKTESASQALKELQAKQTVRRKSKEGGQVTSGL